MLSLFKFQPFQAFDKVALIISLTVLWGAAFIENISLFYD